MAKRPDRRGRRGGPTAPDVLVERADRFQVYAPGTLRLDAVDPAGKGGVIKRLTALMDPRGLKVWPIAAPRDEEKRNHYLWRFWYRLPASPCSKPAPTS